MDPAPTTEPWIKPLIDQFERPAFELAVLLTEDRPVAEEIVQEAFFRVWRSPKTPHDPTAFRPWLFKTVANLARDHARRARRWQRFRLLPPSVQVSDPAVTVADRLTLRDVVAALKRLRADEREALLVRFFDDADYAQVALILGRSEGASRVLVHRALGKLRHYLAAVGYSPLELANNG